MLPAAHCPAIVLPGDRLLLGARSDERGPGLWERKTYPHKVWNIRNVRQRLLPSSCTADQLSAPFLRKGHLIPRWWRSDGEDGMRGAERARQTSNGEAALGLSTRLASRCRASPDSLPACLLNGTV